MKVVTDPASIEGGVKIDLKLGAAYVGIGVMLAAMFIFKLFN